VERELSLYEMKTAAKELEEKYTKVRATYSRR
jgi:hypothetical protein